jgi:N-methylhydantoinase B
MRPPDATIEIGADEMFGADDVTATSLDPVTFSVVLYRLRAVADEMTRVLEHSAYTPILALCRDFSCAVYDTQSRQITMGEALPIHTSSMHLVINEIVAVHGSDISEGDVFLCNDPYGGNTHIGDLVTAAPVFAEGRHVFWSVVRGHQADTGAFIPSSATAATENVWQEGIAIPPTRLCRAGALQTEILELYLRNVRYREMLHGDLLAQLGSVEKGRLRLVEMCSDYGVDTLLRYVDDIISYADRRMAAEIRTMPNGSYTATGWIDGDGFETFDIPVVAKVTVNDESIEVDFSGSGPQVRGGINGTLGTTIAAGTSPILYYVNPDIPRNQGCIGRVVVNAEEGSVCLASFPASTSAATVCPSDTMQDVVGMAMAQAIPERIMAGTARGAQNVLTVSGSGSSDGSEFGVILFNGSGGSGATARASGWPVFDSIAAFGGMRIAPIEEIELLYPLRIDFCEIEPDSMGMGAQLGGAGTRMQVRPLTGEIECDTIGDSVRNPPHGACGGTPGIGGGQFVERLADGHRQFMTATGHFFVRLGEAWCGVSSGGGGYGDPLSRPIEQVRRDVRDGIVSVNVAREVFGVMFATGGLDFSVDEAATANRRAELAVAQRPLISPTEPNAGLWLEANIRVGDDVLVNPRETR